MKVLRLRKEQGLTQGQLAELCGLSQQHVAKLEKGKLDPKLSTLRRVAGALGCEVNDLFLTRAEFERIVNAVIDRHKLKLAELIKQRTFSELLLLCSQEEFIDSFHPYWNAIEVRANKIHLKGVRDV